MYIYTSSSMESSLVFLFCNSTNSREPTGCFLEELPPLTLSSSHCLVFWVDFCFSGMSFCFVPRLQNSLRSSCAATRYLEFLSRKWPWYRFASCWGFTDFPNNDLSLLDEETKSVRCWWGWLLLVCLSSNDCNPMLKGLAELRDRERPWLGLSFPSQGNTHLKEESSTSNDLLSCQLVEESWWWAWGWGPPIIRLSLVVSEIPDVKSGLGYSLGW